MFQYRFLNRIPGCMMECSIYDINLNRIGVLSTWISMVWEESYNSDGSFQIEVQQTTESADLLKVDRYAGIRESNTLMIIKAVQIENGKIIASGYPAISVLSERVSTEVVSNQNAEEALRKLISSVDPWPRLELGKVSGITDKFSAEKSDASLLEYCQVIAQSVDMGIRLRHDRKEKKLLFECYKPKINENAKYSTSYGNMGNTKYSVSTAKLKNVAVVAGAGEGSSRVTVMAGRTDLKGFERREMYVDARSEHPKEGESDESYRARLVRFGEEKLVGQSKIENFSFDLDDNKLSLGDIITCNVSEICVKLKVRVTGIRMTSKNNVTKIEASVGTPIILRRW